VKFSAQSNNYQKKQKNIDKSNLYEQSATVITYISTRPSQNIEWDPSDTRNITKIIEMEQWPEWPLASRSEPTINSLGSSQPQSRVDRSDKRKF
jgi:hypothetical protein